MEIDEIARELQSLAGRMLHPNKERILRTCNGCGYTDELTPSRAKQADKAHRGYFCDRCLNFMNKKRYAQFMGE